MIDTIKQAAVTAIPIALLFFGGWAFLSAYLGLFGVDITEIDLSIQSTLVFSFRSLNTWWALVAAVVGLVLGFLVWHLRSSVQKCGPLCSVTLAFAVVVVTFKGLDGLAREAASQVANQVWDGRRVRIEARLEPEEMASGTKLTEDYLACLSRRGFVNVFSTTKRSFVLCRSSDNPTETGMLYVVDQPGIISSRRKLRRRE